MATTLTRIRRVVIELNFFESGLNDQSTLRHERRSTRLYLLLLGIALIVLVMYIGFGIRTVHVTIHEPTLLTYQTIKLHYAETLKCPCTQIAVKYGRFVRTQLTYHQVIAVHSLTPSTTLSFRSVKVPLSHKNGLSHRTMPIHLTSGRWMSEQ